MTKKEIAKVINKDISTLYNWKKNNPKLYEAVYSYFNQSTNSPKVQSQDES